MVDLVNLNMVDPQYICRYGCGWYDKYYRYGIYSRYTLLSYLRLEWKNGRSKARYFIIDRKSLIWLKNLAESAEKA